MPVQKSYGLAFDRASVRTTDADGRLHVAISNISKATVNPYRGAEIPQGKQLGLSPDHVYHLLRDPEELARAADTFNNLPLLSQHIPVCAAEPQKQFVVGATGTDAVFDAPYLKNSLVVWDAVAIALIESEEQKELSCAYRYRADMTPGVFEGTPYDGVMRDIRGNHVALVEAGRAGPDVVVCDSKPFNPLSETPNMEPNETEKTAQQTPLVAPPQQASDNDLPENLHAILASKLGDEEAGRIMTALQGQSAASDEDADKAVAIALIEAEDEDKDKAEDEGEEEQASPPGAPPEPVTKQAMDAALAKARHDGANAAIERMRAIRIAERECQPILGDIVAQDSAESVYRMALHARGISTKGVPRGAFRHMVKLALSQTQPVKTAVAMDAKSRDGFYDRYPHAKNLKVI